MKSQPNKTNQEKKMTCDLGRGDRYRRMYKNRKEKRESSMTQGDNWS